MERYVSVPTSRTPRRSRAARVSARSGSWNASSSAARIVLTSALGVWTLVTNGGRRGARRLDEHAEPREGGGPVPREQGVDDAVDRRDVGAALGERVEAPLVRSAHLDAREEATADVQGRDEPPQHAHAGVRGAPVHDAAKPAQVLDGPRVARPGHEHQAPVAPRTGARTVVHGARDRAETFPVRQHDVVAAALPEEEARRGPLRLQRRLAVERDRHVLHAAVPQRAGHAPPEVVRVRAELGQVVPGEARDARHRGGV